MDIHQTSPVPSLSVASLLPISDLSMKLCTVPIVQCRKLLKKARILRTKTTSSVYAYVVALQVDFADY